MSKMLIKINEVGTKRRTCTRTIIHQVFIGKRNSLILMLFTQASKKLIRQNELLK